MQLVELELLGVTYGLLVGSLVLEHRHVREVVVVADGLALLGLVLLAKMAATRLVADQRVAAHQLAELEEVGHTPGVLEALVERLSVAADLHIGPELLADRGDLRQRPLQPLSVAGHAAGVEHQLAEFAAEMAPG